MHDSGCSCGCWLRQVERGGAILDAEPCSQTAQQQALALRRICQLTFRTLPSNLQQAAQRYEPAAEPAATYVAPMPSNLAPPRPILRHAASSSTSSLATSAAAANRLRSGSLTLPSNGLSNAFGSSPFSNAWLANPGLTTSHSRSPLAHPDARAGTMPPPGHPSDDDLRLLASQSDSNVMLASDDLNFSTLDYLGLADPMGDGKADIAPASMSERRLRAQQAIVNSGPASRNRASTVSNFARPPYRESVVSPYAKNESNYDMDDTEILMDALTLQGGAYGSAHDLYGFSDSSLYTSSNSAVLKGYKDAMHLSANRPRAISVGTLDNDRRAGPYTAEPSYLNTIPQSPVHRHANPRMNPVRSHSERDLSSRSLAPRHSAQASRAATPDTINGRPNAVDGPTGTHTPQVPTRSLWIGNLDVNATNDALLAVFSQYGPIESLRMLPEKVSRAEDLLTEQSCAFVNFVDRNDAFKARDDVLNRLGGHLTALSETTPVRIGYGKIDPVPTGASVSPGQISTAAVPTPPSPPNVTAVPMPVVAAPPPATSAPNKLSSSPVKAINGEDDSVPTRALWIGSIPSSTPSSSLLQIFSPFGPVESARVLVAKVGLFQELD